MSLNKKQISIIKGMLSRGDKQHWIAAYFGVNSGRIAEINTGQTGLEVTVSPDEELPMAGPYLVLPWDCRFTFEEIIEFKLRQKDLRDGE